MSDTTGISTFEELPPAAKNYLKRLEEILETPIVMVSVSPQRGKTIQMQDVLTTPAPFTYGYQPSTYQVPKNSL
jgi:adenylosuccinate synthase